MGSTFRFRMREAGDLSFRFCLCPRNCPRFSAEIHLARGRRFEIPGPAGPMGRTPDHWKTPSPRPKGLMANPLSSSGESVANLDVPRSGTQRQCDVAAAKALFHIKSHSVDPVACSPSPCYPAADSDAILSFESVSNQAGITQRRGVSLNIRPVSVVPANSYADHTFEYLDDG
jgi:hypothetical protein